MSSPRPRALTAMCRFPRAWSESRHSLLVDRLDNSVGLGCEESIEICLHLSLFKFPDAGPSGPDTGKEEKWPVFAHRKPGIRRALPFFLARGIWFRKLGGRNNSPAFNPEPAPPMR